ncbi:hypothetical protein KP509_36G028200 [Ceratopteris richardii]|uniref:Uncharacterized protein n=1 Tax=Ceratopteris richardii TaxID=49495 RepID=A0A8T2QBQ1_CERRI|nr:hypothetical protein KP509_36G028200 [Ceratopteris richardii]
MAPCSRSSSSSTSSSRSCSPKRRFRDGPAISDAEYGHLPRPPPPPPPPPVRHPHVHSRHRHLCSRYLQDFHVSPSHHRNKKPNAGSGRYHYHQLLSPLTHGHCIHRGCIGMKPPKPLHKAHRRLIKRLILEMEHFMTSWRPPLAMAEYSLGSIARDAASFMFSLRGGTMLADDAHVYLRYSGMEMMPSFTLTFGYKTQQMINGMNALLNLRSR